MADKEKEGELETDVQPQDGCTDIANELMEALIQVKWTESEWAILLLVFRLSYGILVGTQKRKTVSFPKWSDAYKAAGIAKQNFYIALLGLIWKRVLLVDWDTKTLGFNKYYEYWRCPLRTEVNLKKITELIGYNLHGHSTMSCVIGQLPTSLGDDASVIGQLRQGHSTMTQTAKRVIGQLRGQGLDTNKNNHPQRRKPSSFKPCIKPTTNEDEVVEELLPEEEVQKRMRAMLYIQENIQRILGIDGFQVEELIKVYSIDCLADCIELYSVAAERKSIDNPIAYFHGICKKWRKS